jgi:hypothetical protein
MSLHWLRALIKADSLFFSSLNLINIFPILDYQLLYLCHYDIEDYLYIPEFDQFRGSAWASMVA